MNSINKSGYYIIWIEGFDYFNGEKVKSISSNGITYTTKMTEAMRVKVKDMVIVRDKLRKLGVAEWALGDNSFIKTNYAPNGTIFKLK